MAGYTGWFARVKWGDSGKHETVPVEDIRNFTPQNLTDFDKYHWYRVKSPAKYFDDGNKHSAYALIGALAESDALMEEMVQTTRIKFASVALPSDEPLSTASESEDRRSLSNRSKNVAISAQQSRAATQNHAKTHRNEEMFRKFASQHLKISEQGPRAFEIRNNKENESSSQNDKRDTDQEESVGSLKKKIRKLEKQLEKQKKAQNEPVQTSRDEANKEYFEKKNFELQTMMQQSFLDQIAKLQQEFEGKLNKGLETVADRFTALENLRESDFSSLIFVQKWVDALPDDLEQI